MKIAKSVFIAFCMLALASPATFAFKEGTRHITGNGMDLYFMNDKVFGAAGGHPLWAIYNCGSDINGEIDIKGVYHKLSLVYQREGEQLITGTFGPIEMAMGKIGKTAEGLLYPVIMGDKVLNFTIRYEKIEDGHLLNSIIQGPDVNGRPVQLTVDGRLCPFATTGIIMIAVGAAALSAG